MADRSTKIILVVLAAGIWANVAVALRPIPSQAQTDMLIYSLLNQVNLNVARLANGTCTNSRIC